MLLSWTLGCLLLPTPFVLMAQAQSVPEPVRRGYSLLDRGWVGDAVRAFQQAVQRYPQSVEAQLGLAIAHQRNGQDAEAWDAYQQVLALDADNQEALSAIGLLGGYRSEWQARGIEALTTLLELDANNQSVRAQRALLLGYQGRFRESLADYDRVLQNNPTPDMILGAAQIYTYSGDYTQGLALFERYQTGGRTLPNTAITAYALALQETDNAAKAVQVLESRLQQIPQLDATAIQLRAALAVAYAANQQPEAALEALQPLRNRDDARLFLARSLSQIGRQSRNEMIYEEAIALYRQELAQTRSPSFGFLREVADVYSESNAALAESLALYNQLLERQPDDLILQVKQKIVAAQVGQISRVELTEQLQPLLQTLPASSGEQLALAQALIRLDPPAPELLSVYQRLLTTDIEAPFLHFRIAQIYMKQGNFAAARTALAEYQATPEGSQDISPELLLADMEQREGNLAASADRYQSVIASNPRDEILYSVLTGLANVRIAQGNPEAALTIYDELVARRPDDLRFQLGRASLAYQTQRISEAEATEILNRWLTREADTPPPPELFSLVGALPATAERESLYAELLAIEPDSIAINRRLVQLLAKTDPIRAQAIVDDLLARSSDPVGVYFVQGELAQALGELDQAAQAYQNILAQQPENTGAMAALGGVRFQQRRYAEAESIYQRILELKPNDWETRRVLADLSIAQNLPLQALEQLTALRTEQEAAGTSDPTVAQRIRELRVNLLQQRGFQPYWERY
jgi:tetratricopeptide (TPR) repeat protein